MNCQLRLNKWNLCYLYMYVLCHCIVLAISDHGCYCVYWYTIHLERSHVSVTFDISKIWTIIIGALILRLCSKAIKLIASQPKIPTIFSFLISILHTALYDTEYAVNYDRFYEITYEARSTLIQEAISFSPDDQLIDIGGGTGKLALMVRSDQKLNKPVICIDPMEEMLNVARKKENVITVNATAEEFFSSKPDYPLKVEWLCPPLH